MCCKKDHSTAFAWFGMLGVAVFIIAWVCAASIDTAWQFAVNTLSEFGISDTDASLYFNFGCRITGILVVVFGCGRAIYSQNAGHALGGILIAAGGFFLALVGVYTLDSENMHYFVAIMMALVLLSGLVAVTIGNWIADRKFFASIGMIVVFLVVAAGFAFDTAGLEAYGIILALIWLLAESVNLIIYGRKG